jgi:hypothetical protein
MLATQTFLLTGGALAVLVYVATTAFGLLRQEVRLCCCFAIELAALCNLRLQSLVTFVSSVIDSAWFLMIGVARCFP